MNRDKDKLRQGLIAYLPGGSRISGLRKLTTGHTNETYVIEGLDLILRLPPITAPLLEAHDIITQARLYEQLGKLPAAPRVPVIHHICEDPKVLGDPFFIMELVSGDSVDDYQLPDWFTSASDAFRGTICQEWVAAVASLATLPLLDAFEAVVSPEQETRHWREIAVKAECPELVALFDRLLAIPASNSGPASPVHGDCKIANMMFADGHLTAVLDWELGYNGEPLSDLGYLLYFFANDFHGAGRASKEPGMWTRQQIIPAWEKVSGRSAEGVEWYEVLAVGKMAAILAVGYNLYTSGKSTDERFLYFGVKLRENSELMEAMLPGIEAA